MRPLVFSFAWRGGNGSLSVAAEWTGIGGSGGPASRVPFTADDAVIAGADSGLIFTTGALNVAALAVTGGVAVSGRIGTGTLVATGTLVLQPGASLAAGWATLAAGVLSASGTATSVGVTNLFTLAGDATLVGGAHFAAGQVALRGGTLEQDALSGIAIGGGAVHTGTLAVAAGGVVGGFGKLAAAGGVIADAGAITAAGGVLALFGPVVGSGVLDIDAQSTLFLAGATGAGLTVAFAGAAATLELFTAAAAFAGKITGFVAGDAIDIASATITGAAWSAGVLTLTAADGGTLALALPDGVARYDSTVFVPVPDGLGDTLLLIAGSPTPPPSTGAITLDPPAGTVGLVGGPSGHATRLTIEGIVAIDGRFTTQTLNLAGTLVVPDSASFLATNASFASGLLLAEGARSTLTVHTTLALGGALTLLGGAAGMAGTVMLQGGSITLDAASALALGGAALEAGTLSLAAGATLAGAGRIAAAIDVAGLLLAQGGALTLTGPVGGSGTLGIAAAATLEAFGAVAAGVSFAAGATLALFGTTGFTGTLSGFGAGCAIDIGFATLDGAAWTSGRLTLLAGGVAAETIAIAGNYAGRAWQVTPDGGGGAVVTLAGAGGGGPLKATGTLDVTSIIVAAGATAEAAAFVAMKGGTLAVGALALNAGATLDGFGAVQATVADAGMLVADGGVLGIAGRVSGAGTVRIGAGGTLYVPHGIDAATAVAFTGSGGTLELFQSAAGMDATVSGFAAGDAIDLAGAAVLSAGWTASGGLAFSDASGSLGAIRLAGSFVGKSFLSRPDGRGGSLIALVPCFVAGTRIATPEGEVPVECLAVGDRVLTPFGPRPLRWVASRVCDASDAPELRAVRIAAGALGRGVPRRDLLLSPQHALLLGGALVPAVALVEGRAVSREAATRISYHHIAVETHTTVLAEGASCETYQPVVAAPLFDTERGQRPSPGSPCAGRLEGGVALEVLRRRLFGPPAPPGAPGVLRGFVERAMPLGLATRVEGWALDDAQAAPVVLDVLRHGRPCGVAVGNLWRPDLDRARLAGGRCGFVAAVAGGPAGLAVARAGGGERLATLTSEVG